MTMGVRLAYRPTNLPGPTSIQKSPGALAQLVGETRTQIDLVYALRSAYVERAAPRQNGGSGSPATEPLATKPIPDPWPATSWMEALMTRIRAIPPLCRST